MTPADELTTADGRFDAVRERCAAFMAQDDQPKREEQDR